MKTTQIYCSFCVSCGYSGFPCNLSSYGNTRCLPFYGVAFKNTCFLVSPQNGRRRCIQDILEPSFQLLCVLQIQVSPAFSKIASCHFAFTKDLYQYPFLLTGRSPKRIFTFKEKVKSESSIQCLFCTESLQRQCTLRAETGTAKLPPQKLHSASQHQAAMALNCL